MRTDPVGSESDHRAEGRTTKCPESLCRMSALPPSGRRGSSPARTLLPGHRSYRLIRRSRSTLLSFGLSLVRGVSASVCGARIVSALDETTAGDHQRAGWLLAGARYSAFRLTLCIEFYARPTQKKQTLTT